MRTKKFVVLSLVLILFLGVVGCSNKNTSKNYSLTVAPQTEGTGTIKIEPEEASYKAGTEVTLTAIGVGGFVFDHWEGTTYDGRTENPLKVKMMSNIILVAVFVDDCIIKEPEMVEVSSGTTSVNNGAITLGYDIEMGKYEVTFEEYIIFCNDTGRSIPDDEGWGKGSRPIINISWYDAVEYCNWLSEQSGLTPAYDLNNWELIDPDVTILEGYRLPTETEWEYTARGGANGGNTTYAGSNTLEDVAWYGSNSGGQTHTAGEKQSNELGIYDISGNVWEWTNTLSTSEPDDLVIRGGSYGSFTYNCEVDYYNFAFPSVSNKGIGFRLCKTM